MTEEREQKQRLWRYAVSYGIGAIVLVFFLTVSAHFSYTPDETYIYLQYGKNMARGDGYAFNAGMPGEGIPGPLWALLIAGGCWLNLDAYVVAKTLDIIFASFAVLAMLAFSFVLIRDQVYALVAAWIFSFDAWILRWAGSGLESSFGTLLTLLVFWYSYRKEYIAASLVAGLLTLVRLEWGFVFIVVLVDLLLNGVRSATTSKTFLASLSVFAIVVGSWCGFSYLTMGSALPNTLIAAHEGAAHSIGANLWTGVKVLVATQAPMMLALLAGVFIAIKDTGWHSVREDGVPILFVLLLPIVLLLFGQELGSRSLVPVITVVAAYGGWGLKKLEILRLRSVRRGLYLVAIVALLTLGENQYVYHRWILPHMKNVELGVTECLKPIAYWLRSNSPVGSTVIAPEIGVVGYVSGRNILDMRGAVNPALRRAFQKSTYDEAMISRKYLEVVKPDYVIDRSSSPGRLASEALRPVMTRSFSGLGLLNTETAYYTLYEVVHP